MNNEVNLLWTGGWDSTFRLLQLSENDIKIKPFYFIDNNRKSKNIEIERMKEILKEIKKLPNYKAEIEEIIFIDLEGVYKSMENKEISKIFEKMKNKYKLGIQYEWFGLYCGNKKIFMELGIEKSEHSKMGRLLKEEKLDLKEIENDFLENRMYASNKNSFSYNLLKYFIFAVTEFSKKDMENISKEKGWIEIMEKTWFCHSPIFSGEGITPCGLCNPCRDAMALGMEWRMPRISKIRYYLLGPFDSFKKQVKNIIKKFLIRTGVWKNKERRR